MAGLGLLKTIFQKNEFVAVNLLLSGYVLGFSSKFVPYAYFCLASAIL